MWVCAYVSECMSLCRRPVSWVCAYTYMYVNVCMCVLMHAFLNVYLHVYMCIRTALYYISNVPNYISILLNYISPAPNYISSVLNYILYPTTFQQYSLNCILYIMKRGDRVGGARVSHEGDRGFVPMVELNQPLIKICACHSLVIIRIGQGLVGSVSGDQVMVLAAWFPSGAALWSPHECTPLQVSTRPDMTLDVDRTSNKDKQTSMLYIFNHILSIT